MKPQQMFYSAHNCVMNDTTSGVSSIISLFTETFVQLRSFAIVWNTHFLIFSFRARDSFPEGNF